jgi:hypothetical protein
MTLQMCKNDSDYITANEPWWRFGYVWPVFLDFGTRRGWVLKSHCIAGKGNHRIEGWLEFQACFRFANDEINSHRLWVWKPAHSVVTENARDSGLVLLLLYYQWISNNVWMDDVGCTTVSYVVCNDWNRQLSPGAKYPAVYIVVTNTHSVAGICISFVSLVTSLRERFKVQMLRECA